MYCTISSFKGSKCNHHSALAPVKVLLLCITNELSLCVFQMKCTSYSPSCPTAWPTLAPNAPSGTRQSGGRHSSGSSRAASATSSLRSSTPAHHRTCCDTDRFGRTATDSSPRRNAITFEWIQVNRSHCCLIRLCGRRWSLLSWIQRRKRVFRPAAPQRVQILQSWQKSPTRLPPNSLQTSSLWKRRWIRVITILWYVCLVLVADSL